ncbi:pentatricopeptide repeat-containing protein MRL1 [Cucumis melo var. makuwa]|uniref:Pentatricopeptide repeat-containing protein MRL1 n=1 Tax=Cucumis melo var. makuwa TaxID=1194695 RepID=A0A5D3BKV6_CUCMM|nr:pentatricopeptide repeat-containing protein MRL1 [Cucumis melo var. makuwa]TYJ99599.1 pentatricopeptide repeat-containing protein MRL1 [Cucumis melo var. makuwa]
MEVFFSSNPQSLTFNPCLPLNSPSSFSYSRLRFVRRQFLGSSHNLRPPDALRSRRRCRNLGLFVQSPRCILRASLSSNPVLIVVAVVTFSAVSFIYMNLNRRKKNAVERSRSPKLALSQLGRGINWSVDGHVMGFRDHHGEFLEQNIAVKDRAEEKSYSGEEETVLQLQKSGLSHEASVNETLPPSVSEVTTSKDSDSLFSDESEATDPSLLSAIFESGVLQPLIFANEMTDLRLNGSHVKSHSELPVVVDTTELPPVTGPLYSVYDQVTQHLKEDGELLNEEKLSSSNFQIEEPAREDIYMFYQDTESSNQTETSSRTSHLYNKKFSSLMVNGVSRVAELVLEDSLPVAGYVQRKVPDVRYKEGSSGNRKKSGGNNISGHGERKEPSLHKGKAVNGVTHPNGKHVHYKNLHVDQYKSYNQCLKGGRLHDCIRILQDMETEGILDMNKIYHGKFFNICKSKKAVQEAFQYTALIQNPTLSTFNMLMSVCASRQDSERAFQVVRLVQEAGMKADCKLYTTLISTCGKSGKVDAMFEVFHRMVNAGVEPNVHTYGALIDGCARAGQVAKAFGVYGIMRSKNVKPDRVVFNALITACGQSGAVDRAFDVLAEMGAELHPIEPDHITIGALMKACANAGQVDRAIEVYKMIHDYKIKGTPEVYTIAVNCCSQSCDWDFASNVYQDMTRKGVQPDEIFLSALIDVAGHAGKLDAAFEILGEAKTLGIRVGIVSYSSLMGACSNAKNWQKALALYEDLKSMKLRLTVSTVNALITALCDGEQLQMAMDILTEMKELGLSPNNITYSILTAASERNNDLEIALMLLSQAKEDGIVPTLTMYRCIIGMCLRRIAEPTSLDRPLMSLDSKLPQVDNKWTAQALMVYREIIEAGIVPSIDVLSQVLGCLQIPHDSALKSRLIENIGVSADSSRSSNLCSLIDGFGEYDPRAFSLLEEAASLGVATFVFPKGNPIVVDAKELQIHTAEVYLLTVLKGLKHRLAAGSRLPNIMILLPNETTQILSPKGERTINLSGRVGQAVAALLRRLGLPYLGNESSGKIRINGLALRRWLQPKLSDSLSGKPGEFGTFQSRLRKGISHQQRNIRIGNLSLD